MPTIVSVNQWEEENYTFDSYLLIYFIHYSDAFET